MIPMSAARLRFILPILLLGCLVCPACAQEQPRILFFLHNRFLEEHALDDIHPDYGRVAYAEIIRTFEAAGLTVISELRSGNVNARNYAAGICRQIDSLLAAGIPPGHITVAGTSKGGYIAQYVSTLAAHPELNFVFIASHRDEDLGQLPDIQYCGNILTIYERSDPLGVSARARIAASRCDIRHAAEIELHTGLGHGFLFRPLPEWTVPTIRWARGEYGLE